MLIFFVEKYVWFVSPSNGVFLCWYIMKADFFAKIIKQDIE